MNQEDINNARTIELQNNKTKLTLTIKGIETKEIYHSLNDAMYSKHYWTEINKEPEVQITLIKTENLKFSKSKLWNKEDFIDNETVTELPSLETDTHNFYWYGGLIYKVEK